MPDFTQQKTQSNYPTDLSDLIHRVCKRPAMYAGRGWYVAAAFIDGCWYTLKWQHPETYTHDEWKAFNIWLAEKFGYARNRGWMVVRELFPDDNATFAAFPSLYDEFRQQYRPSTLDAT